MTIKELLKAIVMAESQDERMELAEQLTEMMETEQPSDGVNEEAQAEIDRLTSELQAQKQKYIDRFFGGNPEEEKKSNPEEKKTPEEEKAETITTDDIVKEMSK